MLYKQQCGNPDGQSLVLLHGWGMHSGVWHSLVEQLNDDFHITLIDLPGLGHSAAELPEPYTLDAVSDLLAGTAPEQAIWLGWSLGGVIAMAFAQRFQDRVSGLITLGSSPCFVARGGWAYGMEEATYDQFESSLAEQPAKTLQRFNMLQTQGSTTARHDLKQLKTLLAEAEPSTEGLINSLALLRGDYRELFSSVVVPHLNILCRLDTMAPATLATPLKELSSAAKVCVIPDHSHIGFLSDPAPVAEQIRSFAE